MRRRGRNRTKAQVERHKARLRRRQARLVELFRAAKALRLRVVDASPLLATSFSRRSATWPWCRTEDPLHTWSREFVSRLERNGVEPDPELLEYVASEIMQE